MTTSEKIALVKNLLGGDDTATDEVVGSCLVVAERRIIERLYPFGCEDTTAVPARYHVLQCELAVRIFSRMGAEGEVAHNESGINRTYGSVDDCDLLNQIVPYAKVR